MKYFPLVVAALFGTAYAQTPPPVVADPAVKPEARVIAPVPTGVLGGVGAPARIVRPIDPGSVFVNGGPN